MEPLNQRLLQGRGDWTVELSQGNKGKQAVTQAVSQERAEQCMCVCLFTEDLLQKERAPGSSLLSLSLSPPSLSSSLSLSLPLFLPLFLFSSLSSSLYPPYLSSYLSLPIPTSLSSLSLSLPLFLPLPFPFLSFPFLSLSSLPPSPIGRAHV